MDWLRRSSALRIALAYLVFGVAWIVLTDAAVAAFLEPSDRQLAQTVKGWGFVVASAALLFGLVRYEARRSQQLEGRLRDTERLLEKASRVLHDAVIVVRSEDRTILTCNPAAEKLFGWDREELVGRSTEVLHVDRQHYETFARQGEPELAEKGVFRTEFAMQRADGTRILTDQTVTPLDEDGRRVVSVVRDITRQRRTEEKYGAFFRVNPSAVSVTSIPDGRFLEVNEAFEELYGYPRDQVIGKTDRELGLWVTEAERERTVEQIAGSGAVHNREVTLRSADGDPVDVLLSGARTQLGDEDVLVVVTQDIRERKQFEDQLERQALHDTLTGLPNRYLFRDRLVHALERTGRNGKDVALLFVDLDRFKTVNDSLGHPAGDEVLSTVASRLSRSFREADTVARYGGDEFAVILEDARSTEDIEWAAGRVRAAFEPPFDLGGTEFHLTASIGVSHADHASRDPDELIRLADAAMHRVKGSGTTDFHLFDPDEDVEITERLHREAELRNAIDRDEFVVHYHPIYRLDTRELTGAEALVRWDHPERGLVSPAEFIPVAEESGLIVPLGLRVLEKALRQTRAWVDEGRVEEGRFRMSVNLSARQYQQKELVEQIQQTAEDSGVPLSMLTLEITETVIMTGQSRLQQLRERGVRVAIDDFGTGYSSLQYLKRLAADELKLDRSFVWDLDRPAGTAAIVEAVLAIARDMAMDVVAEGIETPGQLQRLEKAGCRLGQGFLFLKPLPPEEFIELAGDAGRDGG